MPSTASVSWLRRRKRQQEQQQQQLAVSSFPSNFQRPQAKKPNEQQENFSDNCSNSTEEHKLSADWTISMRKRCCQFFSSSKINDNSTAAAETTPSAVANGNGNENHEKLLASGTQIRALIGGGGINIDRGSRQQHQYQYLRGAQRACSSAAEAARRRLANTTELSQVISIEQNDDINSRQQQHQHQLIRPIHRRAPLQRLSMQQQQQRQKKLPPLPPLSPRLMRPTELQWKTDATAAATGTASELQFQEQKEGDLKSLYEKDQQQQHEDFAGCEKQATCKTDEIDNLSALSASSSLLSQLLNSSLNQLIEIDSGSSGSNASPTCELDEATGNSRQIKGRGRSSSSGGSSSSISSDGGGEQNASLVVDERDLLVRDSGHWSTSFVVATNRCTTPVSKQPEPLHARGQQQWRAQKQPHEESEAWPLIKQQQLQSAPALQQLHSRAQTKTLEATGGGGGTSRNVATASSVPSSAIVTNTNGWPGDKIATKAATTTKVSGDCASQTISSSNRRDVAELLRLRSRIQFGRSQQQRRLNQLDAIEASASRRCNGASGSSSFKRRPLCAPAQQFVTFDSANNELRDPNSRLDSSDGQFISHLLAPRMADTEEEQPKQEQQLERRRSIATALSCSARLATPNSNSLRMECCENCPPSGESLINGNNNQLQQHDSLLVESLEEQQQQQQRGPLGGSSGSGSQESGCDFECCPFCLEIDSQPEEEEAAEAARRAATVTLITTPQDCAAHARVEAATGQQQTVARQAVARSGRNHPRRDHQAQLSLSSVFSSASSSSSAVSSCGVRVTNTDSSEDWSSDQQQIKGATVVSPTILAQHLNSGSALVAVSGLRGRIVASPRHSSDLSGGKNEQVPADNMGLAPSTLRSLAITESKAAPKASKLFSNNNQQQQQRKFESQEEFCDWGFKSCNCDSGCPVLVGRRALASQESCCLSEQDLDYLLNGAYERIKSQLEKSPIGYLTDLNSNNLVLPLTSRVSHQQAALGEQQQQSTSPQQQQQQQQLASQESRVGLCEPIFGLDPRAIVGASVTRQRRQEQRQQQQQQRLQQQHTTEDSDQASMVEAKANLVRVVDCDSSVISSSGSSSSARQQQQQQQQQASRSRRRSRSQQHQQQLGQQQLQLQAEQPFLLPSAAAAADGEPIYDIPSLSLENSPQPQQSQQQQQQAAIGSAAKYAALLSANINKDDGKENSVRRLTPDQKYPGEFEPTTASRRDRETTRATTSLVNQAIEFKSVMVEGLTSPIEQRRAKKFVNSQQERIANAEVSGKAGSALNKEVWRLLKQAEWDEKCKCQECAHLRALKLHLGASRSRSSGTGATAAAVVSQVPLHRRLDRSRSRSRQAGGVGERVGVSASGVDNKRAHRERRRHQRGRNDCAANERAASLSMLSRIATHGSELRAKSRGNNNNERKARRLRRALQCDHDGPTSCSCSSCSSSTMTQSGRSTNTASGGFSSISSSSSCCSSCCSRCCSSSLAAAREAEAGARIVYFAGRKIKRANLIKEQQTSNGSAGYTAGGSASSASSSGCCCSCSCCSTANDDDDKDNSDSHNGDSSAASTPGSLTQEYLRRHRSSRYSCRQRHVGHADSRCRRQQLGLRESRRRSVFSRPKHRSRQYGDHSHGRRAWLVRQRPGPPKGVPNEDGDSANNKGHGALVAHKVRAACPSGGDSKGHRPAGAHRRRSPRVGCRSAEYQVQQANYPDEFKSAHLVGLLSGSSGLINGAHANASEEKRKGSQENKSDDKAPLVLKLNDRLTPTEQTVAVEVDLGETTTARHHDLRLAADRRRRQRNQVRAAFIEYDRLTEENSEEAEATAAATSIAGQLIVGGHGEKYDDLHDHDLQSQQMLATVADDGASHDDDDHDDLDLAAFASNDRVVPNEKSVTARSDIGANSRAANNYARSPSGQRAPNATAAAAVATSRATGDERAKLLRASSQSRFTAPPASSLSRGTRRGGATGNNKLERDWPVARSGQQRAATAPIQRPRSANEQRQTPKPKATLTPEPTGATATTSCYLVSRAARTSRRTTTDKIGGSNYRCHSVRHKHLTCSHHHHHEHGHYRHSGHRRRRTISSSRRRVGRSSSRNHAHVYSHSRARSHRNGHHNHSQSHSHRHVARQKHPFLGSTAGNKLHLSRHVRHERAAAVAGNSLCRCGAPSHQIGLRSGVNAVDDVGNISNDDDDDAGSSKSHRRHRHRHHGRRHRNESQHHKKRSEPLLLKQKKLIRLIRRQQQQELERARFKQLERARRRHLLLLAGSGAGDIVSTAAVNQAKDHQEVGQSFPDRMLLRHNSSNKKSRQQQRLKAATNRGYPLRLWSASLCGGSGSLKTSLCSHNSSNLRQLGRRQNRHSATMNQLRAMQKALITSSQAAIVSADAIARAHLGPFGTGAIRKQDANEFMDRFLVKTTLSPQQQQQPNVSKANLFGWQLAIRCQCSHCCLVNKFIRMDAEAKRKRKLARDQLKQQQEPLQTLEADNVFN